MPRIARRRPLILPVLLCAAALAAAAPAAEPLGGFSLDGLTVERALVVAGGPGKDGIKSVDDPQFAEAAEATWLGRDTEVLGVELKGEARAYPVRMLEYHQIVNDVVAGVPIAVSYDPLAGTPAAWRRSVDGQTFELGVSGLLYNHNFLMYDRESGSLWSQVLGAAVAGPAAGKRLERIPVRQETAGAWLARHMDSRVLRPPFPEKVHYPLSPYLDYWVKDERIAPVAAHDSRYHAKELVFGVVVGDTARAYLGSVLTREGGVVDERIDGKRVQVRYDSETGTFRWEVDEGVEVGEAYWLSWKAFHPDTQVWGDETTGENGPGEGDSGRGGSGEDGPGGRDS
jgi:hypothetical protein